MRPLQRAGPGVCVWRTCLRSPASAAEWFISRAHGLGGQIPVNVALTPAGRATVIILFNRIEYNVLASAAKRPHEKLSHKKKPGREKPQATTAFDL